MKYLFVECGCCGGYHAPDFAGDCREDAHRYTPEQMEAWHGPDVWNQVLDLEEQMRMEEESA